MSIDGTKGRTRAQEDPARPGPERRRKVLFARSLAATPDERCGSPKLSPLARLIETLNAEKIRFVIIGMTAAVLQGTPVTTFDVDLWIDLPSRRYLQAMNLALKVGAQMAANTVAVLPGDLTIKFVYSVAGLNSFGCG